MFFPLLSPTKKTQCLLDFASQDRVYASIIEDLTAFGFEIEYPFWGRNGTYTPFSMAVDISVSNHDIFLQEFQNSVKRGEMKCHFSFAGRSGKNTVAHYFLHEAFHFFQDRYGLFLTPLQKKGEMPVLLCPRSEIKLLLFCEAMAQTEAIRASWRLYKMGYKNAWYGAILSLNWGGHTLSYYQDLKSGMNEVHAARHNFDRWYKTLHRGYYEKKALRLYEDNLIKFMREANIKDEKYVQPFLRTVRLADIRDMLSPQKCPAYLELGGYLPIEDVYYTQIKNQNTLKKLHLLEDRIGICHNPHFEDIIIGSPPALWGRYKVSG